MTKLFYAMVAMFAFAVVIHFTPQAKAEAFATMPNEGGGKIVLTNEECVINGKKYDNLLRAYAFAAGGTVYEGCFYLDDATESVAIVWARDGKKMRYPQSGFKVIPKERLIPT